MAEVNPFHIWNVAMVHPILLCCDSSDMKFLCILNIGLIDVYHKAMTIKIHHCRTRTLSAKQ